MHYLLSDVEGVKRLISLKPAGLPGTSRSFPYNIRELDRDHCEGLSLHRKFLLEGAALSSVSE